jgi:hypothetical protein
MRKWSLRGPDGDGNSAVDEMFGTFSVFALESKVAYAAIVSR